jgi:lysophospholipase L1-like esterase
VPVIDLYSMTLEQAEKLGPEGCLEIDARDKEGKPDHTHLGAKGQQEIGAMAARELLRLMPDLRAYAAVK